MPKTKTWIENHFKILETDYNVFWSMKINPKSTPIVQDGIKINYKPYQLN